jgi:ABC-2 type transport system ATP-binding protein
MHVPHLTHHAELPEDVFVSVQGVVKAPPKPLPTPPKWAARVLPGVEWSVGAKAEAGGEDIEDDDDMEGDFGDYDEEARVAAFREVSFDVKAGEGVGLVGPDFVATQYLLFIIAGYQPPTRGRVLIRGVVAPVLKPAALNLTGERMRKAVVLTGKVLDWPRSLTRGKQWDEIVEFARLHELTEFPEGSLEWKQLVTKRLFTSTALHLDASVYLVGYNFVRNDPEYAERCYQVLEQRQREGCAIIQNGLEVEDVSRLCTQAIWFERGEAIARGRLGEVAAFAHDRPRERKEGVLAVPVRALLLSDESLVVGRDGGKIELELDVFTSKLDLELALLLIDDAGRETRVDQPEPFVAPAPGIYRLSISLPPGLPGSNYHAKLVAGGLNGSERAHELLSFEFAAQERGSGEPESELEPELSALDESDELSIEPSEVEWNVRRVGA